MYEIRVLVHTGMYSVCTKYIVVRNTDSGTYHMYWYVLSMYRYYDMYDCHASEVCQWHRDCLVFKYHHIPVQYTQYLFPLSKVKT
jgi:hypothetical protein